MEQILKNWYDGALIPSENIIPQDKEYYVFANRIGQKRKTLIDTLSAEQLSLFEEMETDSLRISAMDSYAYFSYGFRLAAQLLYESISKPLIK